MGFALGIYLKRWQRTPHASQLSVYVVVNTALALDDSPVQVLGS